jgi:ketosteroid isomerase-like protein
MSSPARFVTPEEVEAAFYEAFENLDIDLMDQVWGEEPETACVHPGGDLLRGKPAVLQSWSEIFSSASRPSLVYRTLQVLGEGPLAVHLVEEMIRPGSEEPKASRVLATNVYRRGRGGWRLISHHASLPLVSKQRRRASGLLH